MEKMQAVVFSGIGEYEITTRPVPKIEAGDQMLVKVLAASICGTDVHILSNPPGYEANPGIILGHEFVGEVLEVGENVKSFKPGDRLIYDNNLQCGVCPACQEGHYNLCENVKSMGVQIDGVFAQYTVVPEFNAVKISPELSIDKAIFAEPLNCVMGAVKRVNVLPGDTVLILGGGPAGMYYSTLLKKSGAGKVLVSEVSEFRAKYAIQSGADRVINPTKEDLYAEVLKETGGRGADIVVDAVGVLIKDAIECVKPAGQVILYGLNQSKTEEINQSVITRKSLTVIGNFIGCYTMKTVAQALESGTVDFTHMITHKLPLAEFGKGLEAMRQGTALEVVLYPWDDIL